MVVSAIQLLRSARATFIERPGAGKSLCALWQPLFRAYACVTQAYQAVETVLFPSRQFPGGYDVYSAPSCQPTGLSLVAGCGETEWYIYYERTRRPLAGPYDFKEEAADMAALLAAFDWTRPVQQFSRRELHTINQMITLYRRDLTWFRGVIIETWREHNLLRAKAGLSYPQAAGGAELTR